jgi:MFS family permease
MVVATAAPIILQDLGHSDLFAWVGSAFFIGTAVALPIVGRLSDLYDPKRLYTVAVSLFLLFSCLCSLAPTMVALILLRAGQGLAAGSMTAVAGTLKARLFGPTERAKLYSYATMAFATSVVIGPLIGGVLAQAVSWRAIFFFNLLPGLTILWLVQTSLPSLEPGGRGTLNLAGALALGASSTALLLLTGKAWPSSVRWTLLAFLLLSSVLFLSKQRQESSALINLELLKNRTFVLACLAYFCFGGCMNGSLFYIPLYLVKARGLSPTAAGATLIAAQIGLILGSAVAAKPKYARVALVAGSSTLSGFFFAAYYVPHSTYHLLWDLVGLSILGLGLGLALPLYPILVQGSVDKGEVGSATSAVKLSRQLGSSIGIALMGIAMVTTLKATLPGELAEGRWLLTDTQAGFEEKADLRQKLQTRYEDFQKALKDNDPAQIQFLAAETPGVRLDALRVWLQGLDTRIDKAVDRSLELGLKEIFGIGGLLALVTLGVALFIPITGLKEDE